MKRSPKYILGIDEVGRGPIAGPVTVGFFLIKTSELPVLKKYLMGSRVVIFDSKALTEKKREEAYISLKKYVNATNRKAVNFITTSVLAKDIDKRGIMWSLRRCISLGLTRLQVKPEDVSIKLDGGLYAPVRYINQETIIKGDQKSFVISAASIIAKVTRDKKMKTLSSTEGYSMYALDKNKGYGTKEHYACIKKEGLSDLHRKSWINKD